MQDEKKQLFDNSKAIIRRRIMTTRDSLPASTRALAEKAIAQYLQTWLLRYQPAVLAAYWPIRSEADCRDWLLQTLHSGIKVVLPVVEHRNSALVFRQWHGETLSKRDLAGLPAPVQGQVHQPDAILIPCLGFNAQGYRLGYGGGYYDRTLALLPGVPSAGLAFSLQETEFAPDAHDIALHSVITELGIRHF
ncbi:MAG: 5-formyltetrahydrofolate cyclo-ligase [Burkholderiales bacterium]